MKFFLWLTALAGLALAIFFSWAAITVGTVNHHWSDPLAFLLLWFVCSASMIQYTALLALIVHFGKLGYKKLKERK